MANLNIKFNNKSYSIDSALLADATARLEAHLMIMMEERLEGDGAEFYKFAPAALTFRSTAPLSELQEVQINGVAIDPSNYTTEEGSTVITLPIEYLKTLDADNYEISVVSASKSVSGGFSVVEPELNEYGFYYNQPYTAYVESLGGKMVFFNREDGTLDLINVAMNYIETATYTVNGKNATMHTSMGTFTGTYSDDGMSVYCNELGVTASLGDTSIVADADYIYIYKEDLGGYEVTAIDKTKAEYGAIKTGINGCATVALVDDMFLSNDNLTVAPELPNSVTHIGDQAFCSCDNLVSVVIPDSVISIGRGAFDFCLNLISVNLGRGVTTIGNDAFSNCPSLTSITIPGNVTEIGIRAFILCSNLTSITFVGTVEEWNHIAFGDSWNTNVPATHVHCIDGDVAL